MTLRPRLLAAPALALGVAAALSACGTQAIKVPKSSPYYAGAVIFRDHCAGCHTLDTVGAAGSASSIAGRLKTNAPNFNQRKEQYDQVIYAIENGGFSGAIMPENIVVGNQAKQVAQFLAKYSGLKQEKVPTANQGLASSTPATGATGTTGAAAGQPASAARKPHRAHAHGGAHAGHGAGHGAGPAAGGTAAPAGGAGGSTGH